MGDTGGRRFLETVTFQLPAAPIGPATDEQFEEKACALRKALDFEACDCEYLERGSTRAGVPTEASAARRPATRPCAAA